MKRFMGLLVLGIMFGSTASAGLIERACKTSDRQGSSALCSCIQKAADVTLSRGDQKMAAKFFKEPDLAQATRQSDDKHKESFWLRYKNFGVFASKTCG